MGKSSYSTKIAMGALALMGYLGTVNSAEAQQPTRQNRILSSEECLSATGEGVYLKNFCHDLDLRQDSRLDVEKRFGLSALKGDVNYSAISAKKGIEYGLAFLATQPKTGVRDASIAYLQNILGKVSSEDKASVAYLNSAVSDGVIEGSEVIGKVAPGTYAIMTRSRTIQGQTQNRMPVLVNISYNAEKARQDSISRAAADSATNAERAKIREEYVADSTAEFVRDSIDKRNKSVADSVAQADSVKGLKKDTTSTKTGNEKYDWFTGKRKFGIEAGQGSNNETFAGAYVKAVGNSKLSAGFYAQYNLLKGDVVADTTTEVTLRDKQLIGPATYKERMNEITRISRQENSAEVGLEVLLNPRGRVSIPLRVGLALGNDKTDVKGKSTITFTRNDQIMQEPSVIENSMPTEKKSVNPLVFGAGVDWNLNKKLSLGASYNQIARKKGSVRLNAKVRF